MDDKTKWTLAALAALAALALWAQSNKGGAGAAINPAVEVPVSGNGDNAAFYAPYYQVNPGIQDGTTTGNGPTFSGDITVNVNADSLSGLSNKYIPMFGFVGVAAIGS